MNQFKDVFLRQGTRDYNRAANTQKCIRVSGKHNDLEEVGRDTYHHTFFEMLGNWSLGNPSTPEAGYYKEEAITWAWELLTDVWKLPKERLWATVYRTDDEAMSIWKTQTDIDPKHVLKFDEKDNFWEMGETGSCGPCSEIHINLSDDYDNPKWVNAGVEECIEIWNLVFVQYNRDAKGVLHDLPAKHVDTGMGFERITAVLQNKKSNYETDVFSPIIEKIAEISNVKYEKQEDVVSMRVIADHIRTLTFAIADGATPGNEGRGYVLRRILRRAARFGRKLNLNKPFMFSLVDVLTETMGDVFPEIVANKENVKKIIKAEEESFNRTLDRGIELFEQIVVKVKEKGEIKGEDVFKLYDTFGFPVDLTNVMAEEKGLTIDEVGFNKLMAEQKERARKSTKSKIADANITLDSLDEFEGNTLQGTEFIGYLKISAESKILAVNNDVDNSFLIFDKTPFYVESGGQASDSGYFKINEKVFDIIDVKKIDNKIVHIVSNDAGYIFEVGTKIDLYINKSRRMDIMRNHSATHLMHAALRTVLGEHVKQSGSLVDNEKLRFDFSHFGKVTPEELKEIEKIVNTKIWENIKVQHHIDVPFEDAKKMGALMFFGDKYGDKVNVVQFGDYSIEFCGGTHVRNTSEIGIFKIVSESSIASGIRRIEAVTGRGVEAFINSQEEKLTELNKRLSSSNDDKRKLEKQIAELELKSKLGGIDEIIKSPIIIEGVNLFKSKVDVSSMDELKSMGDELRNKIKSGVGILISPIGEKVGIVCVVTDELIKEKKLQAGKIVGTVAKIVGGGGGGRPHLATAGGKDISKIDEALAKVEEIVKDLI
jgi:alanyl-tRNA synthetase